MENNGIGLKLRRFNQQPSDKETLGYMTVVGLHGNPIYNCVTGELPNLNNAHGISCIPIGEYVVEKRPNDPKHGNCFHVLNVPNRDGILIHNGNFMAGAKVDTEGCILVGRTHVDINKDGFMDVTSSVAVMGELWNILPDKFKFIIS